MESSDPSVLVSHIMCLVLPISIASSLTGTSNLQVDEDPRKRYNDTAVRHLPACMCHLTITFLGSRHQYLPHNDASERAAETTSSTRCDSRAINMDV
jgi:hypothetical protein